MRHPTQPICSIRLAKEGDAFNLGYSSASPKMTGYAMLIRKHRDGNGHQWRRIMAGGEITIGRHLCYSGKCGGLREGRVPYYVRRYGVGLNLSKQRWVDRVVARLNRCPEELAVALHSGLVESIEL